jgi:Family of unknown function (DUF6499)
MATTSRTKKTQSAQQWAWEFLRRNPDYRDAFQKLVMLSPEQFAQIGMLAAGAEDHQLDEEVVRALDIQFFDTSVLTGYKGKHKTVGEYIDQSQGIRESLNEPEIDLAIAMKFRLETYSLERWYAPEVELPVTDVANMWHHQVPIEFGLTPAPWAEGLSFEDTNEICEQSGCPVRTPDTSINTKVDKRRRKSPFHSSTALPLIKGIDESIFLIADGGSFRLNQTQASVVLDLSLPIDFQLTQAKNILEQHQDALVRGGLIQKLPKQADRFGVFSEYLKILDLLEAGASHLDIATELDGLVPRTVSWKRDLASKESKPVKRMTSLSRPKAKVNELTQAVRKKIERAIHLRDHGYRALALSA